MKLTVLQENLAKAINTAARFASTKAQLPILGNILLNSQKTKIIVSSTNLEVSVSVSVGAKVTEEGEISVPAKVVSELIDNLPKETLDITSEKEQLKVSASGFSSTVLGINTADFPKIPNSVSREKSISMPKADLTKALSQVAFATSVDETRPVLTGVLFIFGNKDLSLVATDGFRLSRKNIKVDHKGGESRMILPKTVLNELSRSGDSGDEILFELKDKEKQVVFGMGDTILSSRLLEGEYPDFEKIIPKKGSSEILVDKEEFGRAVKLASIFARDGANIVKIKILKESLKISAESGNSGSQEAKVDAKITNVSTELAEGEISFNFRFLEDFLHSVTGEEVKMEFSGPNSPGLFTDTSDSSYLHLIMPVKVQG
ncbi:MAG TPA: DNA polymerase III subunit beta [Patescibacteria group bacterium]|nr:DNA polymerase III subunit beta [Patescibacteria group bacterium]